MKVSEREREGGEGAGGKEERKEGVEKEERGRGKILNNMELKISGYLTCSKDKIVSVISAHLQWLMV